MMIRCWILALGDDFVTQSMSRNAYWNDAIQL